ncbi:MAG TPA: DUF447 domain-containing protein [Burkholderiales bacterium]|nr:DUF447 domain-containing protein [Burkholderiales bacterium]
MSLILETIVTTRAPDGRTHVAPMGMREQEGLVLLAPFRPSTTLEYILASRCAVVNATDDVRVFAGCIVGRREWGLAPADQVPGVRLAGALSHTELALERLEEDGKRPRLFLRRVHQASHAPFRGFNRAQAAVIEAAVLVSRLHLLPPEKIDSELAYLTIAIEKTAGPAELEAWGWLMERISRHRAAAQETRP